jgi:predicted ATPase
MINTLAVSGYRSLRELILPLGRVTVVTGANGAGKSSLYKAVRLLAEAAQGRLVGALAAEGGLPSTLWAGPERISGAMRRGEARIEGTVRQGPVALRLGFASDDLGYAIDLGLPIPHGTAFGFDPEIKAEAIFAGAMLRRATLLADRRGPCVRVANATGALEVRTTALAPFDSMLTHAADPREAPELLALRERLRGMRFYDHVRTDQDAPARARRVGTRTPVLAGDGGDLAAAIQTIVEIGNKRALGDAIADAFGGAEVQVVVDDGLFELTMRQPGLLRPLRAAELSDGTLRYVALAAALLTPRPPDLLVLNEPETSLHADLIAPLARLIASASERTQILVVTHSDRLAAGLGSVRGLRAHELVKAFGETRLADTDDVPAWAWPQR